MNIRRSASALVASALALGAGGGLVSAGPASAATANVTYVCAGTLKAPGVLAGTFSRVLVRGVCEVNSGPARVHGNVTIAPRGALIAAFALNDSKGNGSSSLTVGGSLTIAHRGVLVLGCSASSFACLDDPNPASPTLGSSSTISGNLTALGALGVVVHSSTIGNNVTERGGGGGRNCTPKGVFAAFKSPVYSDYENSFIGGNLKVSGVRSCWYGTIRDSLRGNVSLVGNKLADPDAMEVVSNKIRRNFSCHGNIPAIQFGDSNGMSNRVRRSASGQCSFTVRKPNPAPVEGNKAGPLQYISVRWPPRH